MGTWEVGLYQNDLSADVKGDYIAKLKAGKSDETALQEILSEYQEEMEDFPASKSVCFLIGGKAGHRYKVGIYETSRRNRPKDLTLLGKCKEFHCPLHDDSLTGCFFWTQVDIRDILWGYENQLKLENNISK